MRQRYAGRHREAAQPALTTATHRIGAGVLLAGLCAAGYTVSGADAPGLALVDERRSDGAALAAIATLPPTDHAAVDREQADLTNRQATQDAAAVAAAQAQAQALETARQAEAERVAREAQRQDLLSKAQANPRAVGQMLAAERGWTGAQWTCLDRLFENESNWRWWIANPSSGAYGIPQALPASKMSTVADDWKTNPATQITWGMNYIKSSYGTPCNALAFWQRQSPHWY